MDKSNLMKLITAIGETLLGVPILGGILIIASIWTLLPIMFVLHIVSLVFAIEQNKKKTGNIIGIIGSVLGWIPFVGMIFHIITAIILWIEFSQESNKLK